MDTILERMKEDMRIRNLAENPHARQPLRLKAGKAIGDGEEFGTRRFAMVELFVQTAVGQVLRADFVVQETGELLVLLDKRVPAIRAQDVMTVLDLLERGLELAFASSMKAQAEDLRDSASRQAPQSKLAAALEDPVDREITFEDKVPAVSDLAHRVEAAQMHRGAFVFRELRTEDQGPVVEAAPEHATTHSERLPVDHASSKSAALLVSFSS